MATPTTVAEALASTPAQDDPVTKYRIILASLDTLSSPRRYQADLTAVAESIFEACLGSNAVRVIVASLAETLRALDKADVTLAVGGHILGLIAASTAMSTALAEEIASLCELLASAHESNEDYALAAASLAQIPLDNPASARDDAANQAADLRRARVWVRMVRNYLEVDDSTNAEAYLNKLRAVMHGDMARAHPDLCLHFRLSAARVHDSKRNFLAAASAYHDISVEPSVAEEERLHTLRMAVTCAVLAPAGPPRSRILARLYKDERAVGLDVYGMLEKMFLDRLFAPAEVERFAQGLAPHQLATTSDGSTVLAKAVVEHNLLGVSRLYANIALDDLGVLLGLSGDGAEETTARMMEQGRLNGCIDQINRIVLFEGGEPSADNHKPSGAVNKELRRWDASVQAVAEHVDHLVDALQAEFPEFVAAQIAAA